MILILALPYVLIGQTVFSEDFESGVLPAGWQIKSKAVDGGWNINSPLLLSSKYLAIPANNSTKVAATNDDACNCDKSQDLLITDEYDLSSYISLVLQLDLFFGGNSYKNIKESFKVLYSIDGGNQWNVLGTVKRTEGWETIKFNAGVVTGKNKVRFAFNYSDSNGFLFGAALDNIALSVPLKRDIVLKQIFSKTYGKKGATKPISVKLFNNGSDTINSLNISWNTKSTIHKELVSGIQILPFNQLDYTLSENYTFVNGIQNITITVSDPNGLVDLDTLNNFLSVAYTGYLVKSNKGVLLELATGTWCQWCPEGAVNLDYLNAEYGLQVSGVSVHNSDVLTNDVYDTGVKSFLGFSGFPSIVLNRKSIIDPDEMELSFLQSASVDPQIELEAKAEVKKQNRELTIDVTANSKVNISGTKFFMALIENAVNNSSKAYDQTNAFANNEEGPMGGFELLPNPVPGALMTYNMVARDILGTFKGIESSIQSPWPAGTSVNYQYSGYTIPEEYNLKNMQAIIAVLSNNDQVVNVVRVNLEEITANNEAIQENEITIAPNPFTESTTLNIKLSTPSNLNLKLINSTGQIVQQHNYGILSGTQYLTINGLNLPAGMYYALIQVNDKIITRKVVVSGQ